jgi:hypothetical protein
MVGHTRGSCDCVCGRYWFNDVENNHPFLLPWDSAKEVHSYGFQWTRDSVAITVEGVAVHTFDSGPMPSHAMNFRLITRPHDKATGYDGIVGWAGMGRGGAGRDGAGRGGT